MQTNPRHGRPSQHPTGYPSDPYAAEPTIVGSFVDLATLVIACLLGGYVIGMAVAGL